MNIKKNGLKAILLRLSLFFILLSTSTVGAADWLNDIASSVMTRTPNAGDHAWNWGEAVLIYGMWHAYEKTENSLYFDYCKAYIDAYVTDEGDITAPVLESTIINNIAPGILLPLLYADTGEDKYLTAAHSLADHLMQHFPRTSDGSIAHSGQDELWLDTIYMTCVFLAQMGQVTGDGVYFTEAANQIIKHAAHCQDTASKLFYHAWDEDGSADWSDATTHRSPCFWARGNGWIMMTLVEVLNVMPANHPQRIALITLFQELSGAILQYQHSVSGLWFTVIDRIDGPYNYLETSASAMFVYSLYQGIMLNILSRDILNHVMAANTELEKQFTKSGGVASVNGISTGTVVGNYYYYTGRNRYSNLSYGVGAALMAKTVLESTIKPPHAVSDINSTTTQSHITLSWNAIEETTSDYPTQVKEYQIFKSLTYKSDPDESDRIATQTGTQFTDYIPEIITNPAGQIFYHVLATDYSGQISPPSHAVGVSHRQLFLSTQTHFNHITLPFASGHVSNAQELMNTIAYCNSIVQWNAATQGYDQFIPGIPHSNFQVEAGHAYFIHVTSPSTQVFSGELIDINYHLIPSSPSSFNEVSIPLDNTAITSAAQLLNDVPSCTSVARWDLASQGFQQYVPELPGTDFSTHPGHPYLVNVSAEGYWPNPSPTFQQELLRKSPAMNSTSQAPHAVCGPIDTHSLPVLAFQAYFSSSRDTLSHQTPGCRLEDDFWLVQCSSFSGGWSGGDTLVVDLMDANAQPIQTHRIVLSQNAYDLIGFSANSEMENATPNTFHLLENYPNPFNSQTTLRYTICAPTRVNLSLFNINGQFITQLKNEKAAPGTYVYRLDFHQISRDLSSGIYLVVLDTEQQIQTKKVIFSK